MSECNHEKTKVQMISKEYFGKRFKAKATVCEECGSTLWDRDLQMKFNEWLTALGKEDRDRFVLQVNLTKRTFDCVERMVKEFPGSDPTALLRALSIVYMKCALKSPELNEVVEKVFEGDVFKDLSTAGEKKKLNIYFKPVTHVEIQSWANLAEMSSSKFIEEAVLRMLSFYIEKDPVMRKYWESTFRPELEMILAA